MRYPDDFDDANACQEQIKVLARDLAFDELDAPRDRGKPEATILAVYRRAGEILHETAKELVREAEVRAGV